MGFLEKVGRAHFPDQEHLEQLSSRRLKIWVWFLPCAALLPAAVIVFSGHVVVGLALLIPGVLLGGFIAWIRFRMITPIIEKREQRPKTLPPSLRRPPTNTARRHARRQQRRKKK